MTIIITPQWQSSTSYLSFIYSKPITPLEHAHCPKVESVAKYLSPPLMKINFLVPNQTGNSAHIDDIRAPHPSLTTTSVLDPIIVLRTVVFRVCKKKELATVSNQSAMLTLNTTDLISNDQPDSLSHTTTTVHRIDNYSRCRINC